MDQEGEIKYIFISPILKTIEKFPTGEKFTIHSVDDSAEFTDADFETIRAINNETLIYNRLHKEKFEGQPYTLDHAKGFISKAKENWKNQEKFVFIVRDPEDKIVAAMDIKSADLEAGEIGYWASQYSPGIMTNGVLALCDISKEAGYKTLYGMTAPDNEKSQKVLERAGFENVGEADRKGKPTIKFIKRLQ